MDVFDTIWRGGGGLPPIYIYFSTNLSVCSTTWAFPEVSGNVDLRPGAFWQAVPPKLVPSRSPHFRILYFWNKQVACGSLYSLSLFYIFLLICLSFSIFTYLSLPSPFPQDATVTTKNQRAPLLSCRNLF